jgi:uncharacterized lipoprotein YddW (UPF0748 family)
MKNALYIYLIIINILINIGVSSDINSQNIRGLWVVRDALTSPQKIDSLMTLARACGFTDLYVQIRGRGDAFYNSKYESKAESIKDPNFDPLAYILKLNHTDSIRIHAWLNVFYVWSKDTLPRDQNHIVNQNKSWLAQPKDHADLLKNYPNAVKDANIEGLYVSPLHPQAQTHFLDIVKDILQNYRVDGIHLDYIRYPDQSFDFHPGVVKGFRNRYVLNPEQFLTNPEVFAQKFSLAGYEVFYYHWRRYLMDGLSDFVRRISLTVKKYSPDLIVSAAVKPDIIIAHWNYYQDWDRWLREGWLDYAVPMNYINDSKIFRERLNQYLDKLPEEKYLVGIALYNQPVNDAIRKIAQVQAMGNAGFVLFSYQQLILSKRMQKFLQSQFLPMNQIEIPKGNN